MRATLTGVCALTAITLGGTLAIVAYALAATAIPLLQGDHLARAYDELSQFFRISDSLIGVALWIPIWFIFEQLNPRRE
ncbi:MAG: hypothetical protein WC764_02070 [Candidatus Paceibacterota bacterium]|jgi:O-antigen/teichoic acid export membrane protein